jgi:HK97 family phage major capsid protein
MTTGKGTTLTLAERIAHLRNQIAAQITARSALADQLNAARNELPETGPAPDALAERIRTGVEALRSQDSQITTLSGQLTELEDEQTRDAAVAELQSRIVPTGAPDADTRRTHGDGVIRSEPRTYTRETARQGTSFYRDAIAAKEDFEARDRLAQHMREERVERAEFFEGMQTRDVSTSGLAGITIPQYLVDLVAPSIKNADPFAQNCRQLELPSAGMKIEISRITTGTTAGAQATEHGALSETDIDDTVLEVPIRTVAGMQDVSWQTLRRSTGADDLITSDLVRSWYTQRDYQIINSDETSGTMLGVRNVTDINAVTYTDSTPSVPEMWGRLHDLISQCESDVPGLGMTHWLMHTRRWQCLSSGLSTNNTVVQQPNTPPQLMGVNNGAGYGPGVRGILAGYPVIVDANIPTTISSTQDVVLGVNVNECLLWTDPGAPLFLKSDEIGMKTLSSTLVVWGYTAFTAGRYPACHGTISGTGLTTPTFDLTVTP